MRHAKADVQFCCRVPLPDRLRAVDEAPESSRRLDRAGLIRARVRIRIRSMESRVRSEELCEGMRVRVCAGEDPRLLGRVGTVTEAYGDPSYRAVEVRFGSAEVELLWFYELEAVTREMPEARRSCRTTC